MISMTAKAPKIATSVGERPRRIAGITNSITIVRLATSPTSARSPRNRPVATRRTAKLTPSQSIAPRRSKSENE